MSKDDLAKKLAKGRISHRVSPEAQKKLMQVHEDTGIRKISDLLEYVIHKYEPEAAEKRGAA